MTENTVISLILYFTGKYLAPAAADDIKVLIGALQPVFVAVIAGIFVEDYAVKRAGGRVGPPEPAGD